uniref:Chitin-binding type-2 domain-containing protein n=1 Tax=Daphnia galeata TaxID=27404 RepID=A0A8J2S1R5_9CRUS|nr:unnamed protein product [Daphnia galeata]
MKQDIFLRLTMLLCISCLAVTSAAGPTKPDGERRQIFRDEVDHLKGVKRPELVNQQGYFPPQEQDHYDRPTKPAYQDNYQPGNQGDYRPTYQTDQDNYEPPNQDVDYPSHYGDRPPYHDDYKPSYEDGYKPNYQHEHEERPPYQDDYKPTYDDDYKPTYEDYKPSYDDKPTFDEDTRPWQNTQDNFELPFDDEKNSFFKPVDFNINFYGSDHQKPDAGYAGYDEYEEPKPYVPPPPQYDDYEPVKPVVSKPYKPVVPKPYKPRPTYPKEIVLLQPSSALKSNAYADKYTTSSYRPSHIPGNPGEDYPNYTAIPQTSFDCLNLKNADFSYMFSDQEAGCQVFHTCHHDGRQDSFLCPLGTIFDLESQTCDWWFNVRCI